MTKNRAVLELILAGVFWGFGFVAAVWALKVFTPIETLFYRFFLAFFAGECIYFAVKGPKLKNLRKEFFRALPAGLFLGGMLLLQTIGLRYTTATKSGFITSLYVILVPLFNSWFFKAPSTWRNYSLTALALGGTFMLVDANLTDINAGDLWTLGCSIFAAFHIIYIGRVSDKIDNAFRFNNFQSLWCLLALTPLLLTQQKISWFTSDWQAWLGILCLGLGSSVLAFYLQIRTQRVLTDSTASMLFLLESPFAAAFGFLLLNERLNLFQVSGALIILLASSLQVLLNPSSKQTAEGQQNT